MWDFFIKRNKFSYLLVIALVCVGLFAITNIPRESAPEVVIPVGIVTTALPGAPAIDVESLVTDEIETGLSRLQNVREITSTSREGISSVTVEFESGADIDQSIDDLNDEINRITASLPREAEDPIVREVDFVDQPILTFVIAGDLPEAELLEIAEKLEDEVESIPGVSRVETSGARTREVQVVVSPASLAQYSLNIRNITSAIQDANTVVPIGKIEQDGISYNVSFDGDVADANALNNVVVSTKGGAPVYLRDVATVIPSLDNNSSVSRLSVGGAPSRAAISFDVYKQTGGDITRIAATVNERIDALTDEGEFLSGLTVTTILDQGKEIRDDLVQLTTSGLQTVVLVILFLVIAIGWREGLIAGTAIPLSFIIGFIGLYLSGNTINFLSLFSMILAVGILVDSAIVMVEGINRRMKDHTTIDKKRAALDTIKTYAAPLIAGTLTTVAMFTGLFIVSGVTGQFIKSIPFTVVFLLFASLFVALAIIPLIAATMLKRRNVTKFEQQQVAYANRIEHIYSRFLRTLLGDRIRERRFLLTIRSALLIAILLPVLGIVQVIFFPDGDIGYLYIDIETPEGTVREVTDRPVRQIEEFLYRIPEIESFLSTIGRGSQFGTGGSNEKLANIFITLTNDRDRTSTEIIHELRTAVKDVTNATVTVGQPQSGPPTGAPISIRFIGDDIDELTTIANRAAIMARDITGTTGVSTNTDTANTEFVINLRREIAGSYGLTASSISRAVRSAIFGNDATTLKHEGYEEDVVVRLDISGTGKVNPYTTNKVGIDALQEMDIPTPSGQTIALGHVTDIALREQSTVINRINGDRVVTLTSDVEEGSTTREVEAAILKTINERINLPESINISTGGGESEESNQAFREMFIALIVGVLLMIGILTLQFNSYRHTRYVLSILPYSLIGILGGLAITGTPLSFPSLMGFIALSGIVVNNSILLIDMMNTTRRLQPEMSITDVVVSSASKRLRPILLTTITTIIGMVPLLYSDPIWAPLAYSVMFGLAFSVLITLVLIPIIYHRNPGELA